MQSPLHQGMSDLPPTWCSFDLVHTLHRVLPALFIAPSVCCARIDHSPRKHEIFSGDEDNLLCAMLVDAPLYAHRVCNQTCGFDLGHQRPLSYGPLDDAYLGGSGRGKKLVLAVQSKSHS